MSSVRSTWGKPPRPAAGSPPESADSGLELTHPISLHEVMSWETRWRRMLFRALTPVKLLVDLGIDPVSLLDRQGNLMVHYHAGQSDGSVRFELYHAVDAQDPVIELELADTAFSQLEVLWLAIQDPQAPRFDIDMMPDGQTTMRGTLRRNVLAEEAALASGLAPGQVRAGLRAFEDVAARIEALMSCMNQREYIVQPLFYHTAVLFEQAGCAYIQGHARMQEIDRGFAPGGYLRARLDGSSPFRRPELADSVRGRAWAIHAGILGQPWDRVRMVRRLGVDAGIDTCPGLPW